MQDWLRYIVNELFKVAKYEGVRFVRESVISAFERVVQGLRRILMLQYIILIVCFLNALSLFSGLFFLTILIFQSNHPSLLSPLIFCGSIFLVSSGLLLFTLREKTWMKVIHIDDIVDKALPLQEVETTAEIDIEDIEDIVEKVLEKKLQNIKKKKAKAS